MKQEIGIGLVGYGGIGRMHALCFQMLPIAYPELPKIRLVAVQTASTASAARAQRELGDLFTTTSLESLLAYPSVDIVDCCAPTSDHNLVALSTLNAGKALFCEKPLAATFEEANAIVAAAHERGLMGGVNFHFRHVPAIQEAHRLIGSGLLGDVIGFHLRYYRASNLKRDRAITWRFNGPGSGVLVDLGSHVLDLVLHLLGPIAWVAAHTRTLITERPGPDGTPVAVESDDVAWLQIGLANGGIGSIEVSKLVPGAGDDLRIEAYGSHGTLLFDAQDPNGIQIAEGSNAPIGYRRIATLSRTNPAANIPNGETPTGVIGWHLASIRNFLGAYLEGHQPSPSLADGLRVDQVIAAAQRSAARGGIAEQI
jgi:predicted dehydrogenase